ncbi:hypothetical protein QQS21_012673 [Conoideocrella luteorostrata]|uniref:Peptidase M43 pregnancy-associated plasma-A domain-containing protein n=1 Tax=Conoideocrella luteorostrata TaxID=1105319 RepID=A0AAJ0FUL7_9HYPO|nr:hypothetical protein QQS21_012673 [Conoideocrella luteorostrata]
MLLKLSLLAVIMGAATLDVGPAFICDSIPPGPELLALHQKLGAERKSLKRDELSGSINVDVYIHVVANNETATGGWLNVDGTLEQMEVLNAGFAPSNIAFSVQGVDRTVNSSWTGGAESFAMKQTLHKGDYRALNLYFLPNVFFAGQCFFPNMNSILAPNSVDLIRDGCIIKSNTVPDLPGPFGMGKTAIHEVGHWFGLLHTFQGGCDETAGDYIGDTPAQESPTNATLGDGCPLGRDSCLGLPGLDPIHNYMDYSSDQCYTEFTPEQMTRMKQLWKLVRFGTIQANPASKASATSSSQLATPSA